MNISVQTHGSGQGHYRTAGAARQPDAAGQHPVLASSGEAYDGQGKDRGWNGFLPGTDGSRNEQLFSAPAAVSWNSDHLDVFARGGDDTLRHAWWDGENRRS